MLKWKLAICQGQPYVPTFLRFFLKLFIFHFFPSIHFLTYCLPYLGPYSASDCLTPNQSSALMPSTNQLNERQHVAANQRQSKVDIPLLSQEEKTNLSATGCKQCCLSAEDRPGPLHKSRIKTSRISDWAELNESKTRVSRLNWLHKDQARMSRHKPGETSPG